jgi:23S rRNA (cytidine1920-2'-O)/16S rRNA (cytidine1409-2'-O)-methyltransferase
MTAVPKQRLDLLLVERGLAPSREAAQRLILAGAVRAGDGNRKLTAGLRLPADTELSVTAPEKYVSRGGLKLEHALDFFKLDPAGLTCLDVGASTGGFTDCLLQRGAEKIIAVDVGRGQLDWRLRSDARVELHEKINARNLPPELAAGAQLVVMDVSFISITLILPRLKALLPQIPVLSLIKPQFEAGRESVGPGGVIRDPQVWRSVLVSVAGRVATLGYDVQGPCKSPIEGGDGNREFFYLFQPGKGMPPPAEAITAAVEMAQALKFHPHD